MKTGKKQIRTGVTGVILGTSLLFQSGCQYMPWYKEKDATAKDTVAPVGQGPAVQAPLKVDSAFNADFDSLEQTALTHDPYQVPSRPALPPVIVEDPVQDPYIPDLSGTEFNDPVEEVAASFPQADDDLTYIVQKGDTLWGISQTFKVSLNKLLASNNLTRTSLISVGQSLSIPGVSESTPPVPIQPAISYNNSSQVFSSSGEYTVKKGDHLTKIAYLYGTSVRRLKEANGLVTDRLMIGQKLVVPSGGQVNQTWQPTTAVAPASSSSTTASRASSGDYHVVRRGDFPGSIARLYGLKTKELMAMNNISDPRKIQIGTKLLVRKNGSVPSSVATLSAATPKAAPTVSGPVPSTALSASSNTLDLTTITFQPEEESEGQLIPVSEEPAVSGTTFGDVPVMTLESSN